MAPEECIHQSWPTMIKLMKHYEIEILLKKHASTHEYYFEHKELQHCHHGWSTERRVKRRKGGSNHHAYISYVTKWLRNDVGGRNQKASLKCWWTLKKCYFTMAEQQNLRGHDICTFDLASYNCFQYPQLPPRGCLLCSACKQQFSVKGIDNIGADLIFFDQPISPWWL